MPCLAACNSSSESFSLKCHPSACFKSPVGTDTSNRLDMLCGQVGFKEENVPLFKEGP